MWDLQRYLSIGPGRYPAFQATYLAVGLLCVATTSSVHSQLQAQPPSAQPAGGLDISEVEGKIAAIAGNTIKIETEDGQERFLVINSKTSFKYEGTAQPQVLSPGTMIRFNAQFDALGNPQSTVEQLEIFTPIRSRRMSREQMLDQTSGIYPVRKDDDADRDQKDKRRRNRNSRQSNNKQGSAAHNPQQTSNLAGVREFRVVGRLRAAQGGRMQVLAGNRPIMLQVAAEPKISVVAGDMQFCRQGDTVEATGLTNPAQPSFIQVESIVVEGAEPLGLAQIPDGSKTNRPQRSKRNRSTPKKTDDPQRK